MGAAPCERLGVARQHYRVVIPMDPKTKAVILENRYRPLQQHVEANGETPGFAAALAATEKELSELQQEPPQQGS